MKASEPLFFELIVPARHLGERREVLRYNLNDPRDMQLYHALIKVCKEPWRPEGTDQDWLEDRLHENGNYQCVCLFCRVYFLGHKRRITCRKCSKQKP